MKECTMSVIILCVVVFSADYGLADNWLSRINRPMQAMQYYPVENGFQAWLLITADQNWREKWDSPQEEIPRFTETDSVRLGGSISILTFYANPSVKDDNTLLLHCDIRMLYPDGTVSFAQNDIVCGDGERRGKPSNVRLSYAIIDFFAEIDDPPGVWTVEVDLRDMNSGKTLQLRKQFQLVSSAVFAREATRVIGEVW